MNHHAYLLIGDRESTYTHACSLLGFVQGETVHPDRHFFSYETFGIADARFLRTTALQRPVSDGEMSFLLWVEEMTYEAQNALLKLFEDPGASSRFVLMMPQKHGLEKTLLSRFALVHVGDVGGDTYGEQFLKLSYALRLKEIEQRHKKKDIEWFKELFSSLLTTLHREGEYQLLKELMPLETYVRMRGASPKMIFEHIAHSLPIVELISKPYTKK